MIAVQIDDGRVGAARRGPTCLGFESTELALIPIRPNQALGEGFRDRALPVWTRSGVFHVSWKNLG